MAWEWVAPVATSVVGISGIIATLRAGNQQQRATERRAWLDYRREAYARYLTCSESVQYQAVALYISYERFSKSQDESSRNKFIEEHASLLQLLEKLTTIAQEAALIAGDEVASLLFKDSHAIFRASLNATSPKGLGWVDDFTQYTKELINAMRVELQSNPRGL